MEIEKFQLSVESVFGKRVVNRPDCEELSIAVYNKTKLSINYNTLRRFFGIAGQKNNSNVSKSSLDILAVYCGFLSYFDFCTQLGAIDNLGKLYKLQLEVIQQDSFTIATTEKYLSQLNKNEHQFSLMNFIVLVAFNRGDLAFLKQIFKIKKVFNGDDYFIAHLYFLIQTIGVQVQIHPQFSEELWKSWANEKQARFFYFELFVDMNNLINSHYIGIEYYLKHTTKHQDLIFAQSLLAWRYLMLGNIKKAKKEISKIENIPLKEDIHPIPIARFFNCKLLMEYMETGNVSINLLNEISKYQKLFSTNTQPFFEHFITEGLAATNCIDLALNFIHEANKKVQLNQNFYLNGSSERMKIIEAYCLMKNGNKKESKELIKKINLEDLDSISREYDSIFFYAIDKSKNQDKDLLFIKKIKYQKLYDLL
jgi:hypothetical protein